MTRISGKQAGRPHTTENDNWKLQFDDEKLFFPGWTETKPITQAISQARWLQTWIESSTGDKHYVTPVLAIPGWFIRQTKASELRITNGKSFDFLAKNKAVLCEKQIMVISFQLEKMCRTVEVKSYNKKYQETALG